MQRKQLLEHSYRLGLSHIPSALSMLGYVDHLFSHKLVTPDDFIIIGKPFGSQAYYLVWQEQGYLGDIDYLSVGVKHDEIDFVDYSEETVGNALGVAAGIAMTTDKLIWANISDATLQMGNTLEAMQFIGQRQLSNIRVTVDFNDWQVTGRTSDIINVEPVFQMCYHYGWTVTHGATFNHFREDDHPGLFVVYTAKGSGVEEMTRDPKKWHYRKIESQEELERLCAQL